MSSPLFYSLSTVDDFYGTIITFICHLCSEEEVQAVEENLKALQSEKKCGEFVISTCKYMNERLNCTQDKDVESVYFLLIEIVKQLGETEECKNLFLNICDCLFDSMMTTHLKARILSLLLNSMPSFKACRVALLQKIIKFAHESKSLEFFYNYLMEQENGNWKDVMGDYRQVLISLKDTLLEMKKKKEAYQCLLKLVSTYDTNEPDYVTYANECIVEQLKNPVYDENTRSNLEQVVQGLSQKNSNLYELLNIVNNGDLVRLEAFFGKAGDVLTQYQLSADVLKEHCRLLALTKLCSGCQQMSYSEIAHSLNVTPAEAEVFIVLAIQYGLIQGRMDQIKEEFTVLRAQCIGVDDEWKTMLEKIGQWKENVQFVIDSCDRYMK